MVFNPLRFIILCPAYSHYGLNHYCYWMRVRWPWFDS